MCEFVGGRHVAPGWGCCVCRTYNGLQRRYCHWCHAERHDKQVVVPPDVKRCACGFGWVGPVPIGLMDGRRLGGRCPVCGDMLAVGSA
jgi:hypothetical protein